MSRTDATAAPIRLLIADDQPLIRRALALTLGAEPGIEIVGQAADGAEAIEQALALAPDVVVMDLQMPRASGVVAGTDRLEHELVVVIGGQHHHAELVFEAIRAGARAYLLKDAAEHEVLETIRAVHRGESRLSPSIARKVIEQFRRFDAAPPRADADVAAPSPAAAEGPALRRTAHGVEERLTDKEERILQLIAEGKSNKQIAATVFLAEGTVKNYVSRIMDKLHARSRTELAVRAVGRRG